MAVAVTPATPNPAAMNGVAAGATHMVSGASGAVTITTVTIVISFCRPSSDWLSKRSACICTLSSCLTSSGGAPSLSMARTSESSALRLPSTSICAGESSPGPRQKMPLVAAPQWLARLTDDKKAGRSRSRKYFTQRFTSFCHCSTVRTTESPGGMAHWPSTTTRRRSGSASLSATSGPKK